MQRTSPPSTPKSVSTTAPLTVVTTESSASANADINPILGIAALVLALAAFGVQLWIFLA